MIFGCRRIRRWKAEYEGGVNYFGCREGNTFSCGWCLSCRVSNVGEREEGVVRSSEMYKNLDGDEKQNKRCSSS